MKIKDWLTEKSVKEYVSLNAGATETDIKTLEHIIKEKLPEEVISFYKIHNGQKPYSEYGLFDFQELLSMERIADIWSTWNDVLKSKATVNNSNPEFGIKANWWNPLWIPITVSTGGDIVCIDLDPAEGGTKGQVIEVYHDDDVRTIAANSFSEWINNYAEKFTSGEMEFSESYGIIDRKTLKLMEDGIE